MRILIGIDDTDNLETRGTGYQARSLGFSLMEAGLIELRSITRHQLLVDPRIPYTSHNSSACLAGDAGSDMEPVIRHCKEFLLRESAHDSDAGLCVVAADHVPEKVIGFGRRAKTSILTLEEAQVLARESGLYLDGFLNTRMGMIGSLAAVGLRAWGNDGRLLWTPMLRETQGVFRVDEFKRLTGIDEVLGTESDCVPENAHILITDWCRPVMRNGRITLFAEKIKKQNEYEYQSASKELIKSISR